MLPALDGTYTLPGWVGSVTINAVIVTLPSPEWHYDYPAVNWTATLPIEAVIVYPGGGANSNVYVYDPADLDGDQGLTAPGGTSTPQGVQFCYDADAQTYGRIVIRKAVAAAAPSGIFNFHPDWGPNFSLAGNEQTEAMLVPTGAHSVVEVGLPAGWSLRSVVCSDGSSPSAIGVTAEETVICVFANAYPMCFGRPATIIGTAGADTLSGTPGDDVIVGLGGKDVINGLGGRDRICGGSGADQLYGGGGDDRIGGGPGIDSADGGLGTDTCRAESTTACE